MVVIDSIGGPSPVQAEGTIDGKPFYFRARYNHWSMSIGGADVIGEPDWYYCQKYGTDPFGAGYMPEAAAREFIRLSAEMYALCVSAEIPITEMGDRGLVNVEIVKKGEGGCGGRPASDVQIRTTRGETVWVPETDVIARKPNPEEKA